MNIILLTTIVMLVLTQTIIQKNYLDKYGVGVYSLPAMTALFAAIVFFITAKGNLNFSSGFFPYAAAFAVCYCLSAAFTLSAFQTGPISVASLVLSYSTMIPGIYSIIAYSEPINTELVIGVILMMLSLLFANIEKKGVKKKIKGKWLVYITIATISNGGCSLVQKIQQMNVGEGYDCKNEFMIAALIMIVAVMLVCAAFSERKELGKNIKKRCCAVFYAVLQTDSPTTL